jgi:hypothetical protein
MSAVLRWHTSNPLHGPGLADTSGVYRIDRRSGLGVVSWALFISGTFHAEYRTRRAAKAAAQLYEDEHPWDRTGHR